MELRDYLHILWGRRWLILLCTLVAAGSAFGFSLRMVPVYQAEASVFVGPRQLQRDDAAGALQELTFSQEYMATYAEILTSRPLAQKVIDQVNTNLTAEELTERITARVVPDTRLIEVSVESTVAALAQQYTNALVDTFVADQEENFGITASVLEPALEPESPIRPQPVRNALIGAILGIMLGVGIAFLLEQLDTTVKTRQDVEKLFAPLPVIAAIPWGPVRKNRALFITDSPNSPQAESIRMLRTNLQFYAVDEPIARVLVTSAVSGEGKSTVAANLAAGIAAAGSSVLLIEADLRKPIMGDFLLESFRGPGLTDVLTGKTTLVQAIRPTEVRNLRVLTAGRIPPNPSELLGSGRMADLLDEASTLADMIVLDTPPSLPVTDATALAPQTDGVVLVVRAGSTGSDEALQVAHNMERLGVRVLGVAVNFVEQNAGDGYYGYAYATTRRQRRKGKATGELDDFVVTNARPTPSAGDDRPAAPSNGTSTQPDPHTGPPPAEGTQTPAAPEEEAVDPAELFRQRLRRAYRE